MGGRIFVRTSKDGPRAIDNVDFEGKSYHFDELL